MCADQSQAYVISATAEEPVATLLAALLEDWNMGLFWPRREAADQARPVQVRLDVYCASREEAAARRGILQDLLTRCAAGQGSASVIRPVAVEDWAESWKKHFHARRVSKRIIVRPPWEAYRPAAGEWVIVMEPGMSFGTGEHETTQACLQLLDQLQGEFPAAAVLDIGCGTGVLAIAAAMLGFPRVLAIDNDPAAVRVTLANAALNGVGERVSARAADVQTWRPEAAYDLVLANLLAGLLIENAGRVSAPLADGPDSRLVLSGILTAQYAEVRAAYERLAFQEVRALVLNDWTTGCFRRAGS